MNRVPAHRFEWLVPGLLRDKCIALIKLLPKNLRKLFVPVPEAVDRIFPGLHAANAPLLEALSAALFGAYRERIPVHAWQPQELESFYRANFRVLDGEGALLDQDRDLAALKARLREPMQRSLQQETSRGFQRDSLQRWDFGELPDTYRFEQAGVTITAYPALVDERDSVAIRLLESPAAAQQQSERGLIRLLQIQTATPVKYLRRELLRGNSVSLQLAGIEQRREQWIDEILEATYREVFVVGQVLPRSEEDFARRLRDGQGEVIPVAQRYASMLEKIAAQYAGIRAFLRQANQLAWLPALEEVEAQLSLLFPHRFIADTPWRRLQHYPRYLQAIEHRVDRWRGHFARDRELSRELSPLHRQLAELIQRQPAVLQRSAKAEHYRWMLEELRVSLFAQSLGTEEPVSGKRLREWWPQVLAEVEPKH